MTNKLHPLGPKAAGKPLTARTSGIVAAATITPQPIAKVLSVSTDTASRDLKDFSDVGKVSRTD